jgi:restriction system protein
MATWMVRAGRGGRYFQEFREKNFVAVGWNEAGDLGAAATRAEIQVVLRQRYPSATEQWLVVASGQIFRFWRGISEGDRIVTYDPAARSYACGTVIGPSYYDGQEEIPDIRTKRMVNWSHEKSRDELSVAAINTLGAILTLFSIPDNVSTELWTEGPIQVEDVGPAQDEAPLTVPVQNLSAADIASLSAEAIKDAIAKLDWDEMQELVAGLLRGMGYKTVVSPPGADRGKDIVASPDGLGMEEPRIIAEVKHRTNERMGAPEIRSFLGGRHPRDRGLYVSTGGFTKDAYYEADRAQIPLTLIDFERLVEAVLEYYPKFDEETRQLLPLARFYWPIR